MRKPLCDCGTCKRCLQREYTARWRAKTKCSGCGKCKACRTARAAQKNGKAMRMSLEAMRSASAQAIRDEEIRAYGPQSLGSTLDPSHIFSLRESRSK